jgi:hypothetical protein
MLRDTRFGTAQYAYVLITETILKQDYYGMVQKD